MDILGEGTKTSLKWPLALLVLLMAVVVWIDMECATVPAGEGFLRYWRGLYIVTNVMVPYSQSPKKPETCLNMILEITYRDIHMMPSTVLLHLTLLLDFQWWHSFWKLWASPTKWVLGGLIRAAKIIDLGYREMILAFYSDLSRHRSCIQPAYHISKVCLGAVIQAAQALSNASWRP